VHTESLVCVLPRRSHVYAAEMPAYQAICRRLQITADLVAGDLREFFADLG